MIDNPRTLLLDLFRTAVAAADPAHCVPRHLPPPPHGRTVIIGAGKAAAAMARAVETHWDHTLSGCVITRYGHSVPCDRIQVIEAGHPVPDAAGQDAARAVMESVRRLNADDLVLCLISGGASSLLSLPAPGITLAEKQMMTRQLLTAGATIAEINCVRKHLSAIKGGRLAAACQPAQVLTLLISDVPGNDPSVIGSGPTVPDPSTCADALAILRRYQLDAPTSVMRQLESGELESPKPNTAVFKLVQNKIIATPSGSLVAAALRAKQRGVAPITLGSDLEGEARDLAGAHVEQVRAHRTRSPCVLLSGGEATVTVSGGGQGGPNAEFLLALAIALDGAPDVTALAADTDGIDGTQTNAGAVIGPETLALARARGLDPMAYLERNDGYGFFAALDALLVTGPTRTNVNDFRAIYIGPHAGSHAKHE